MISNVDLYKWYKRNICLLDYSIIFDREDIRHNIVHIHSLGLNCKNTANLIHGAFCDNV